MMQLYLSKSQLLDLKPVTGRSIFLEHEHRVYLSERNIQTLLVKLERVAQGEVSKCTVIKHRQPGVDVPYNQTMDSLAVTGLSDEALKHLPAFSAGLEEDECFTLENIDVIVVPDDEYYGSQRRPAGGMLPVDEAKLNKPASGVAVELARQQWGYGHGGAEGEWAQYDKAWP